jgi:feruloyl esterase
MPGAEAGGGGWRAWLLGTGSDALSLGRQGVFQHDWLRYLAFPDPRPGMVPLEDFDRDRDWQSLQASSEIWGARSTDYDAFRERGGRMIVWHGTGDPTFSGHQLTDWYDELGEAYGNERMDFARLFFIPGVYHCAGFPGLGSFDALQA